MAETNGTAWMGKDIWDLSMMPETTLQNQETDQSERGEIQCHMFGASVRFHSGYEPKGSPGIASWMAPMI
jgi:hypothetical protein